MVMRRCDDAKVPIDYSDNSGLRRRRKAWRFEFKCTDAPATTKSIRISLEDLGLDHLWVIYPEQAAYPLGDRSFTSLRQTPPGDGR
jgi:hypothetical protein